MAGYVFVWKQSGCRVDVSWNFTEADVWRYAEKWLIPAYTKPRDVEREIAGLHERGEVVACDD